MAPSIVYGETTTLDDCLKTPFENRNLSAGIRQASFFEVKMCTECFNVICTHQENHSACKMLESKLLSRDEPYIDQFQLVLGITVLSKLHGHRRSTWRW